MQIAFPETGLSARLRLSEPMTDEDLIRFCADNDPFKVERDSNGDLILMSPAGLEGGGVEGDVFGDLLIWAREDGRGKAYGPNAGVTLADGSMRAADACWISWSKLNELDAAERKRFARICPEFVIEVRSESDRLKPLQEKMEMWLSNGAQLAWLVDPSRKAVEIYRPGREPEVQEGHSAAYGEGSVAGFVLELGKIWG
jgi:Uma2 family endonuclease